MPVQIYDDLEWHLKLNLGRYQVTNDTHCKSIV
jgi:hypothetical protein